MTLIKILITLIITILALSGTALGAISYSLNTIPTPPSIYTGDSTTVSVSISNNNLIYKGICAIRLDSSSWSTEYPVSSGHTVIKYMSVQAPAWGNGDGVVQHTVHSYCYSTLDSTKVSKSTSFILLYTENPGYIATGSIVVSSSPAGAKTYLDGAYKGTTPLTLTNIPIGTHSIKLTMDDYRDKTKSITVTNGGTAIVSETLIQKTGYIVVSSTPTGAKIYLDDTYKGTTPQTLSNIRIGTHSVKLSKEGYHDKTKSVTVTDGGTSKISTTLELPSGSITITSEPTAAKVFLDDKFVGTTPLSLKEIRPGKHTIKLVKDDYDTTLSTLNVVDGKITKLTKNLIKSTGAIKISTAPSGAKIYFDDKYVGVTPKTLTGLSLGKHRVKLVNKKFHNHTTNITIKSTDNKPIYAQLEKKSVFEGLDFLFPPFMLIFFLISIMVISPRLLKSGSKSKKRPTSTHGKQCVNHKKVSATAICHKCGKLLCNDCTLHHRDGHPYCKDCWNDVVSTKKGSTTPKKSKSTSWSSLPNKQQPEKPIDAKKSGKTPTVESKPAQQEPVAKPSKKSNDTPSKKSTFAGIFGKDETSTKSNDAPSKKSTFTAIFGKDETSTKSSTTPVITSAFGYKGATIQYKVKVENPTSEPIADIKINLYVPDVFLVSESTKTITMLKPSESKTVTFEIRPTGECGDCEVSGKVVYYDYFTKKTTGIDIPPKSLSIVCPMLKMKEISEPEWHSIVSNLLETEENTGEIDMPAETLFIMTSRIVKDMHMHRLEPEITNSQQLYNGVARFYGEGIKGLKYAAQVEVVGGAKKSRLILKTWAEKEEALTGFYHGLLDEVEKRVQVKGYIDDSIVQNFYHHGDKIGTQVKDSIVQRSNIGAGGDVDAGAGADTGAGGNVAERKCPTCGTVAVGNGKYCNECGGKL